MRGVWEGWGHLGGGGKHGRKFWRPRAPIAAHFLCRVPKMRLNWVSKLMGFI